MTSALLDPYTPLSMWDSYVRERQAGARPLTSMGAAQRDAFTAGVRAVLTAQNTWDSLTVDEAIAELRKGTQSVFFPLFSEDPKVLAKCDTCGIQVAVDAEALCPDCGREVTS